MNRLRQCVTLLLVALWMPATVHCALEQTGLLPEAAACADQCRADNCDQFENGLFQKSADLTLKAPTFLPLLDLHGLSRLEPEGTAAPRVAPERSSSPPGLSHYWHCVVRAALPGRAP